MDEHRRSGRRARIRLRTLYRLIDRGELPAYKLGRVIRLRTAEVRAYRDANGGAEPD